MGKFTKYASSSQLMEVVIKFEAEKFKFNLYQEVKINEDDITSELTHQTSSYSFLTMLHKSLIKLVSDKKITEKRAYATSYLKYKGQTNSDTGRPNSDDMAKSFAELDDNYIKAQHDVINAQFDLNRVEACVKAFEQRKDILQTLSANSRRERAI